MTKSSEDMDYDAECGLDRKIPQGSGRDRSPAPAMKRASLASRRWDAEYARGRYAGEPPLEFAETIIRTVADSDGLSGGKGLYVGCGNGRNFVRLASAGLDLEGIDPSPEAIAQLAARYPPAAARLRCVDLEHFVTDTKFDYLIAIQVFQHGDASETARHFKKASELVRRGGALFLRVNSASTEVHFGHRVKERSAGGSFTVRYVDGPKRGTDVRFFSKRDLIGRLSRNGFEIEAGPSEDRAKREPPKTGTWSQWEVVARNA